MISVIAVVVVVEAEMVTVDINAGGCCDHLLAVGSVK